MLLKGFHYFKIYSLFYFFVRLFKVPFERPLRPRGVTAPGAPVPLVHLAHVILQVSAVPRGEGTPLAGAPVPGTLQGTVQGGPTGFELEIFKQEIYPTE